MTHFKHTPGPWVISTRDNPSGADISGKNGQHFVCDILYCEGEHPIDREYNNAQDANIHLIAAAPELLEALKSIKWIAQGNADKININTIYELASKAIELCDA